MDKIVALDCDVGAIVAQGIPSTVINDYIRRIGSRLGISLFISVISCVTLPAQPGRFNASGIPSGSYNKISGQWAFWWNRFLDPLAAVSGEIRPDAYVPFPDVWQNYPVTKGASIGYATLFIEVTGLAADRDWALKLSSVLCSARMYVNGTLVLSFGNPGINPASERPEWRSRVLRIHPGSDGTADIVLQISNFHDRAGGSTTPILIGTYDAVASVQNNLRLEELCLFGALSMMGLYFFVLFIFRPVDRSSLYFALLCLALAVRILCYDEYFVLDLIPGMSWELLYKLGYVLFSLPLLFYACFVRSFFPKFYPRILSIVVVSTCMAYTVLFAVAPTLIMSRFLISFQVITTLIGLFICSIFARAVMKREPGSVILTVGFVILFGSAIHDILVADSVLHDAFIVQFGLLAFLFSMSIVITRKFAASFSRAELLGAELVGTNLSLRTFNSRLEEEVASRTTNLEELNRALLAEVQQRKDKENLLAVSLAEKELYQNAIESLEQAVMITGDAGRILAVNRAFTGLYGYSKEEVIGRDPDILNPGRSVYLDLGYSDDEYDKLFKGLWTSIESPQMGTWKGTVINRRKSGSLVWADLVVNAIYDDTKHIIAFVGVPFDISERLKKENSGRIELYSTIAALAELRDNETGNHMKRVGIFARILASAMGMVKKYCDDIQIFAPMHDIGKVGIRDSILLAERRLMPEEFEEMKAHTILGYNIVKGKKELELVSAIALRHHEKWDGSGYPGGLKGEDIPLSARITAIADVYDALRSTRSYKKPWSHAEATQEILASSGSHFDPQLIQYFSRLAGVFEKTYADLSDD